MSEYEFSIDSGKSWREVSERTFVAFFGPGEVIFRIRPRTIKVNGFDVPEPMREAPAVGESYFTANVTDAMLHGSSTWSNDKFDHRFLSRGICHATKEAAIAHAKAMLGIDTNGGDE